MEQIKKIALPAVLAYVGVRLSEAIGVKGTLGGIAAGIAGAGAGLFIAQKF